MKELYFVDYNQNVYDKNGNIIGRIGNGYIVDRTRSDLIFKGEELGKFINIRNIEEIDKFSKIINKEDVVKKSDDFEVNGLKTITKEENGIIKNYIVTDDGHIYDDNNSYLNFNEKRKMILMEWLEDSVKSSRVSAMTPEELDKVLIEAVSSDYKEYYFDDANDLDKEDEKKRVAANRAEEVDGRVNGELGIVENGAGNIDDYSTIEERNNGYSVVTPTVVSNDLKSNVTTSVSGEVSSNVDVTKEEEQQREVDDKKYYYMDSDGNVYDQNGNMLEGVNPQYLVIDEENNLWYQNEFVGIYGGTLDDLSQAINQSREKANVRVLKKDNAGFGQIIIVALVLICLAMFVGVIVLSFIS